MLPVVSVLSVKNTSSWSQRKFKFIAYLVALYRMTIQSFDIGHFILEEEMYQKALQWHNIIVQ